jgi:hypothetical protein
MTMMRWMQAKQKREGVWEKLLSTTWERQWTKTAKTMKAK